MNTDKKRICPRCRAAQSHRSQMRGVIERNILRPVGIRAYRCAVCDQRFLRFGGGDKQPDTVAGSGSGKTR